MLTSLRARRGAASRTREFAPSRVLCLLLDSTQVASRRSPGEPIKGALLKSACRGPEVRPRSHPLGADLRPRSLSRGPRSGLCQTRVIMESTSKWAASGRCGSSRLSKYLKQDGSCRIERSRAEVRSAPITPNYNPVCKHRLRRTKPEVDGVHYI